jgi:hypothetical protein
MPPPETKGGCENGRDSTEGQSVGERSLGDAWAGTTTPPGRLTPLRPTLLINGMDRTELGCEPPPLGLGEIAVLPPCSRERYGWKHVRCGGGLRSCSY